ncbi:MAG: hypothetical protein UX31_C0001G0014 [Candidatus Nomurabacteria bacterium GW2011_GWA1_46_11]|nr:MAG: hypothetical protein UX31_C0001G0014 [Candidatus Nomurabacteria bacterium GW2011_GWA1_46_11]
MSRNFHKTWLAVFALVAVGLPVWTRVGSLGWQSRPDIIPNLFPVFGLLAFSLLWLHALSGVFEPWLRRQINFDKFVDSTSLVILISIILHPLLAWANVNFSFKDLFAYGEARAIWLGIFGLLLLLTYDVGKFLKKYKFFSRNWTNILTISTVGFLLTFFHSLSLGSDLQSGFLRKVWIFYGVTAIFATIYTYGYKRRLKGSGNQADHHYADKIEN